MSYTTLTSGRQVRPVYTRHGWAEIHVTPGGQWEVTRGGKMLACGSVWFCDVEGAKDAAEKYLAHLIETED